MDYGAERRFLGITGAAFALLWVALAIEPVDRSVWWLENVLTIVGALSMTASYIAFPLSRISYACIFCFGVLHLIGAHHTYSLTPYDAWSRSLLGVSIDAAFGFERNHYDRFVHFLWGLLIAYPAREVFVRIARVRGFWGYLCPVLLVMASSVLYETIEWLAAVVFGGELGVRYLGTQGDEWDGHKDMTLAAAGAFVAMAAVLLVNACTQPGFAAEWRASLAVRGSEPLGERALRRRFSRRM